MEKTNKINKEALIKLVSEQTGKSNKEIKETVESLVNVIKHKVASGDEVEIFGFLNFKRKFVPSKSGMNQLTKKPYTTEDKYVPKVKVMTDFEKVVNGEK